MARSSRKEICSNIDTYNCPLYLQKMCKESPEIEQCKQRVVTKADFGAECAGQQGMGSCNVRPLPGAQARRV